MWIKRQISDELVRLAETFPVVVLTGPRQIGKTSVIERTFSDFSYVAMDVASNAEAAETRPDDFLARHHPPVVLDEVQYAPAVFRRIKTEVDARRGENGLFVLTGSQSFPLMESVADSLGGRAAVIQFQGLSGAEWSAEPRIASAVSWPEFTWRGGFPALWAEPERPPSRDRWYQGYLATYLERDVRNLLNVGSLRDFERFLRSCAARTGQLLNMSEIGRDVGISPHAARQWISVLVASGQLFLLEPYHRSLGKRLVKSPKLYFTDTGLAAFLAGFGSADALWSSQSAGAFFENQVVGQWLRWQQWQEPSAALWFWRNRSGTEVDLLIELDGRLTAVECKLKQRPSPRDLRGIDRLTEFYGDELIRGRFVACTTTEPFEIDGRATAIPGWTVWA